MSQGKHTHINKRAKRKALFWEERGREGRRENSQNMTLPSLAAAYHAGSHWLWRPLPVLRTDDTVTITMWYLSIPEAHGVRINGETSPASLQSMGGVGKLIIQFPLLAVRQSTWRTLGWRCCLMVRTPHSNGSRAGILWMVGEKTQLSNTIMTKRMGKDKQL